MPPGGARLQGGIPTAQQTEFSELRPAVPARGPNEAKGRAVPKDRAVAAPVLERRREKIPGAQRSSHCYKPAPQTGVRMNK
eukprot:6102994-Pyramimonas_sp.AAC.1